jgi:hypothetical protein
MICSTNHIEFAIQGRTPPKKITFFVRMTTNTEMDQNTIPRLMNLLKAFLPEENVTRFISLVKDTGSLIAGGSLLKAYHNAPERNFFDGSHGTISQDIDIYVPIRNANAFLEALVRDTTNPILSPEATRSYRSSLYCTSFLQKNGIKKVYTFRGKHKHRFRELAFDVMIVRNRRTPLEVVNNFDLTFCQIWFDGTHVYASHPEDVKNKKGVLQGEYVPLFLQGNLFLKRRINKYIRRGYSITLDPQHINTPLAENDRICKKPADDILLQRWASRILLQWFLKIRNPISYMEEGLTPTIQRDNILIVPQFHFSNRSQLKEADLFGEKLTRRGFKTEPEDDGYDSEEYTENEPLYDTMYSRYLKELGAAPVEESSEFKKSLFYREANKLLEIVLWPNIYNHNRKTIGQLLKERKGYRAEFADDRFQNFNRIEYYQAELLKRCTRKGTSFITQEEDVTVYDLHEHPLEAGISADDLEAYLSHHITDNDKTKVPCYYKPNPAFRNDPANCTHVLSLSEVRYIVSDDFYKKYTAPLPVKIGLDQYMTHYNQTLQNAKEDTPGWGMIYHHTVCPFCLQFESRDSGCAYMTHENRKRDPASKTPYCDERLVNTELIERYRVLSELGNEAHLQFCAECGRPCVDHNHISTTAPYTVIDVPVRTLENGRREHDYATCVGGGRPELFARILAIRKVYREAGITDPKEERRQASLAADNAPNDPELMAQGKAIFEQEEATRHWTNAPIPTEKVYNSENTTETNSESNNNNTVMTGGKPKRRTYKKKRGSGTRKK